VTFDTAPIKARRAAITPGEWIVEYREQPCKDGSTYYEPVITTAEIDIALVYTPDDCEICANATFIAAAPADIDALLAEVERLTAELATAREILEVWNMLQAGLDKGDTLFIESYYISRYEAIVHHRTSAGGTIIGPKHVSYVSKSTTLSDVLRKAFAPISTQRA